MRPPDSPQLPFRAGLWVAVLVFAWQPASHAYVDPGVGNYFVQLLIAGIVGGLYALKLGWTTILLRTQRWAERVRRALR